jgi:acid stress-induced BolA-like protein IbaG/YrbA
VWQVQAEEDIRHEHTDGPKSQVEVVGENSHAACAWVANEVESKGCVAKVQEDKC